MCVGVVEVVVRAVKRYKIKHISMSWLSTGKLI